MAETRFKVRGMKCTNCVARATQAVAKVPGVTGSEFDFKEGSGLVRGEFDADAVAHALTAAGYPAEVDE